MRETDTFVVHIPTESDRALAERFGEIRPPIRDPFDGLEVTQLPWGPVLGGRRPRTACRLVGSVPASYAELVQGTIVQLELHDLEDPLVYLHGTYRSSSTIAGEGRHRPSLERSHIH
jgi:flavin reductase (DIM6/NTAB) family NADH-FMN oxidoreductase RutF